MMAFLSTASLRASCMAFLSSSVQVPIVKVGVLHLVMISTDAGLLEMVVVQVVMVVVMVAGLAVSRGRMLRREMMVAR